MYTRTLLTLTVFAVLPSSVEASQKGCAVVERLGLVDRNAISRQHELIEISGAVVGENIIQDSLGFVGTTVEIRKELETFLKKDEQQSGQDDFITLSATQDLNQYIREHPIVGLKNTKEKYDPKGCFGFCFGRATVIHAEAVKNGINPEGIFKIWAAGKIKSDRQFNNYFSINWDYHVAAMFKTKEGPYIVVDPFFKKALPAREWIALMQRFAEGNWQTLFQVTDPRRFEVDTNQMYSLERLFWDKQFENINRFHRDYFESIEGSVP